MHNQKRRDIFLIFLMISGLSLVGSGFVGIKNQINIHNLAPWFALCVGFPLILISLLGLLHNFSLLGFSNKEDFLNAKAQINKLQNSLENHTKSVNDLEMKLSVGKASLSASEKALSESKRMAHLIYELKKWCSPDLLEFPVTTSIQFRENSLNSIQKVFETEPSFSDLIHYEKFVCPDQWILYWCLANACRAAREAAKSAKDENGISRIFLSALEKEAKYSSLFPNEERLQIAFNSIFEQSLPAMKEAAVGADMLLIIAGNEFIPNGFARIFWIQAKKPSPTDNHLTLHYDRKNEHGLQIEALSKVDLPEKGSIGMYMQYSDTLPYIPAVEVKDLEWKNKKYKANLAEIGTRLPEFIVGCTSDIPGIGSFKDTDDILEYLKKVSNNKPLYIVTVEVEGREHRLLHSKNQLLSDITNYYKKELGLIKTPQHKQDNDLDFGRW